MIAQTKILEGIENAWLKIMSTTRNRLFPTMKEYFAYNTNVKKIEDLKEPITADKTMMDMLDVMINIKCAYSEIRSLCRLLGNRGEVLLGRIDYFFYDRVLKNGDIIMFNTIIYSSGFRYKAMTERTQREFIENLK